MPNVNLNVNLASLALSTSTPIVSATYMQLLPIQFVPSEAPLVMTDTTQPHFISIPVPQIHHHHHHHLLLQKEKEDKKPHQRQITMHKFIFHSVSYNWNSCPTSKRSDTISPKYYSMYIPFLLVITTFFAHIHPTQKTKNKKTRPTGKDQHRRLDKFPPERSFFTA